MITSFNIESHKYHIIEKVINDIYIKIYRRMLTKSMDDMIQPILKGGIMGYETVAILSKNGRPLDNVIIKLYKDMRLLDSYTTNNRGECTISIGIDRNCCCSPFDKCSNVSEEYMFEICAEASSEPQEAS